MKTLYIHLISLFIFAHEIVIKAAEEKLPLRRIEVIQAAFAYAICTTPGIDMTLAQEGATTPIANIIHSYLPTPLTHFDGKKRELSEVHASELAVSPDGRYLQAIGDDIVTTWDLEDQDMEPITLPRDGSLEMPAPHQRPKKAIVSPDGRFAGTLSQSGKMIIRDNYRTIQEQSANAQRSVFHIFTPDSRYFIALRNAFQDKEIHIYDLYHPTTPRTSLGSDFDHFIFLPGGEYLVTLLSSPYKASDKRITLWNWRVITKNMEQERAANNGPNRDQTEWKNFMRLGLLLTPEQKENE